MSEMIWKIGLELIDEQIVELPSGGMPISAGVDPNGNLSLWFRFPEESRWNLAPKASIKVRIVGTGNPFPRPGAIWEPGWTHLDSVLMPPFVWHIFWAEA